MVRMIMFDAVVLGVVSSGGGEYPLWRSSQFREQEWGFRVEWFCIFRGLCNVPLYSEEAHEPL